MLDAATLLIVITEENCGAAVLLHHAGSRTADQLADLFRLGAEDPFPVDEATLQSVSSRLERAGYPAKVTDAGRAVR